MVFAIARIMKRRAGFDLGSQLHRDGKGWRTVFCVYLLASKPFGTLYVGETSDLVKRVFEHKSKAVRGFTAR